MASEISLATAVDTANTGLDAIKRAPIVEEDTGIKCLRIQDVSQDKSFNDWGFTEVTPDNFRKFQLKQDDIMIARTGGSVGVNRFIFDDVQSVFNNGLIRIRSKTEEFYPKYIYYLLQTDSFKSHINSIAYSTSAQPNMKIRDLLRFSFLYQNLSKQKAIAHILGSLDDKIELNRQMNETLEAMAQALFKSWFVDFDPVIDNAIKAGKPIPDEIAARAELRKKIVKKDNPEIQRLFPDEFEFTEELGWIPKGWEINSLDDIANYLNGLALQKFRPESITDDYLPVVKIAQLREGVASHDEKASTNIKPEYIIDNGDVIFSWSGSLLVDIWCGGKAALNQHLFKVTSDKHPKWFYLNYTKYHLAEFQRIAADKAVTMGHIKRGHLKEALCLIPKDGVDAREFDFFSHILNKQVDLRIENRTLANLRDTLLPKLMSGEIRVSDAAAMVEDA